VTAQGVQVQTGPSGLVLVTFPASWLSVELDVRGPNEAEAPETLRQVLAHEPGAVALVCGPMFYGGVSYNSYQRAPIAYRVLDRRRGIDFPVQPFHARRGATVSVMPGGAVHVLDGGVSAPGAVFAMQGYPEVIRGGRNNASQTRDLGATGRAALCVLRDGRVAFAVANTGIRQFADLLLARGVVEAVYLDGGGSTMLAVRDAPGGRVVTSRGLDSRRVPSFLLAVPPGAVGERGRSSAGGAVPSPGGTGILDKGVMAGLIGGVVGGGVALALKLLRR